MQQPTTTQLNNWAEIFLTYRPRLLALARRNLNTVLASRVTPEDIVQDTLSSACTKLDFFTNCPGVPVYCKLRTLLLQNLTNLERKHLQCQKRDVYKEVAVSNDQNDSNAQLNWNFFADTMTGAFTRIARADRYQLLRNALQTLSENDRQILELRHFDGLSNTDCAEVLQIEPKAASIRYIRALQRLQKKLNEYSEFRP